MISEQPGPGRFEWIPNQGAPALIWHDANDYAGVIRAAEDLRADVERVSGRVPAMSSVRLATPPSARPVIVGTYGHSVLIDALAAAGKINPAALDGKREAFVIAVVEAPFAGVEQALVIAGSDKRGTIYGIYEMSEQLGVSPWYWWADVLAKLRAGAHVAAGAYYSGEPAVRYRGIFLNDEAPALTRWTNAKFGGRNRQFYTKVFELLLRLRGNYLWPAMWGDAFNEDDPENPRLADEYGIVMGTSHHEPMMRAQQEWSRRKNTYGNAQWNYATNAEGLRAFWRDGVARNHRYENLVTIGMRGDGDEPMIVGGNMAENSALLADIIRDQRTILAEETGRPAADTPQLWALYKEVQDYYDHGLRPPDDVTLLWCDDNWGNLRRLPRGEEERGRSGGHGVYYHFDYVGGPRSYKWLNTNPLPKIQEQMNLAWENGVDRIWIVNVGDLKPMEVPIEFFLRMAWEPDYWTAERCDEFLLRWAERDFGPVHAAEVAALVAGYTKLNGLRKPELLAPGTYSLTNYREAERVLSVWRDLATRAQALHTALPEAARDAFYQLAVYPILACANLNELYVAAARNTAYAAQSRASTNVERDRVQALFQNDAGLTTYWNTGFAGGRWVHLMDQVHIGYTSWNEPATNIMPTVVSYAAPTTADLGVALEGSLVALAPGGKALLPGLSSEGGAVTRYIELFRRGTLAADYTIEADQPWVLLSTKAGRLGDDQRVEVGIDWARAPIGRGEVVLTVRGSGSALARTVRLPFEKAAPAAMSRPLGYLDPEGYVAIEAPNYDRAVATAEAGWKTLPDHGRSVGGVTPWPVTAPSVAAPGGSSPRLEYDVYLRRRGELAVRLIVSPTLNYLPGQPLRCAVSLNDETPRIIEVGAVADSAIWADSVRDSVRTVLTAVAVEQPGHNVFKFWMVDPGVVLQRVEIDTGGLRPSYLGPPESPRGRRAAASTDGGTSVSPSVTIEAESGARGADMLVNSAALPVYVTVASSGTGSSPGGAGRVIRYQVTFPAAGDYRLFARVRVGPAAADDDSFFVGNGFGAKSATVGGDWRMLNGLSGVGFSALPDVVMPTGGSVGSGVWKWIDVSGVSGALFTVPAGALTQVLDIGGREDGLDIDKLVFGPAANTFTVDDLMQGGGGSVPGASIRVMEAEAAVVGAELTVTTGSPGFVTVTTDNLSVPGAAARVLRFTPSFTGPGVYRLFARVRVGSGGASDDSLFVAAGFGAKNPAVAGDWRSINNFAFNGHTAATAVVTTGGSAGTGVWKWLDLSALGGGVFTVPSDALVQTFDLGGRENGLDIDKIVFAPDGETYTVATLEAGVLPLSPPAMPVFTVAVDEPRQVIDGFGASSAWNPTTFSDALSDQFFSTGSGIGLSLLRVRIAPDGTTVETGTARKAIARGAKVWATPWSPPAAWKSNNDTSNGGTLLPERRADWAARLADFAVNMQAAGVPILAISAQNEPNYTATWESCIWTPAQITAFIRDHLGPALVERGVATRVLAAEPIGWTSLAAYGDALLGDAAARPFISHIATHQYTGVPFAYPAAAAHGKALWQTEFSDSAAESDPGMDSALRVAETIHDFFTVAEGNAWHYWWLVEGNNTATTGALTEYGVLAKRGWALGNWSRFVRPGHRRVVSYGSGATVRATAFHALDGRRLTIVAVNSGLTEQVVPLAISGGRAPSLARWETSAERSLTALPAILPAADGSFTLTLPPRSVTSFVADLFSRPPVAVMLSGSEVAENQPTATWVGNLSAVDPDVGETFTYSLVPGEGDADNAVFVIIGNRLLIRGPLDYEAGATRRVRVRATDAAGASVEAAFVISITNDAGEYADWAAQWPAGQRAPGQDASGDGVANLLAYALGERAGDALRIGHRGDTSVVELSLPGVLPADVSLHLERSPDLVSWEEVAARSVDGVWTGDVLMTSTEGVGGGHLVTIPLALGEGRIFYRLKVELRTPEYR